MTKKTQRPSQPVGVPISKTTGVAGWETDAEAAALIQLAETLTNDFEDVFNVVELGGEYGRSATQFAYALRHHKSPTVTTVDKFPTDHPIVGDLYSFWRLNVNAFLDEQGLQIPVNSVVGLTWEMGQSWVNTKTNNTAAIHLLFIDAGHSFHEVQRDIQTWSKFVPEGGVMVFHDYAKKANAHPLHHEVKRAVDGWFGETESNTWKRQDMPDTLVAFKRLTPQPFLKEDAPEEDPAPIAKTPSSPKPKKSNKKKSTRSSR